MSLGVSVVPGQASVVGMASTIFFWVGMSSLAKMSRSTDVVYESIFA
ncbi:hypothetical protein [Nonomuraea jiangxiensis]|nr:hypothetical protein [Nonomuraea jiangxiensis]